MASPKPVDTQNVNVEEPSVPSVPGTSTGSGPGDGSFLFRSAPRVRNSPVLIMENNVKCSS
jgi:hypothetical protein